MSGHLRADDYVRPEQPFEDLLAKAGFTGGIGENIELKAISDLGSCKTSCRAKIAIFFFALKLGGFLANTIAHRRDTGMFFICCLLALLEYVYVRTKLGRRMVDVRWWSIVTPGGKVLDFVEVSKEKQSQEKVASCIFWYLFFVFGLAYLILAIVYLCSTHLSWIFLALAVMASNFHIFFYFRSIENGFKETAVPSSRCFSTPQPTTEAKEEEFPNKGSLLDDSQL